MNYLAQAIFNLRPTAQFVFTDNDYSTVQWHFIEGEPPSSEEVELEIIAIKNRELEEIAQTVEKRAAILDRLGLTEEEAKLLLG